MCVVGYVRELLLGTLRIFELNALVPVSYPLFVRLRAVCDLRDLHEEAPPQVLKMQVEGLQIRQATCFFLRA